MAMLAGLNYDEAGTDIEQIISAKLNTSASIPGTNTIALLSNLKPISCVMRTHHPNLQHQLNPNNPSLSL